MLFAPPLAFEISRSDIAIRGARPATGIAHGKLNTDGTNAILYPSQFAAQHNDIEWIIGAGRALDPEKYFIIVVDQLGNGLSSSPSHSKARFDRMRFPTITIRDDVAAQYRLLIEALRVQRLKMVVGYSMGAQQAHQWAVSHSDIVERIVPFCGTARTTAHNAVFLEDVCAALTTDSAWMNGQYETPPVRGLRAFARVYAGWGFSQESYKQELYRSLGFTSAMDCVVGLLEKTYMKRDASNILSMLRTWQLNDVSAVPAFGGCLEKALGSVRAKTIVMASQTDLYFPVSDMRAKRL